MKLYIFLLFFLLSSCTYSVTMLITEGKSSDVVDETASNTPSVSVEVPLLKTSTPKL